MTAFSRVDPQQTLGSVPTPMKQSVRFAIFTAFLALAAATLSAEEPTTQKAAKDAKMFRPGEKWLDDHGTAINAHGGGILVVGDVYYWFGEHKIEGDAGNFAQVGVHVYASKNLYDWEDKGIALKVSEDPKSDIVKGCILERPKVISCPKTKKFVMWFHLELKDHGYNAARAGTAIADSPTGPYQFVESFRLNPGKWPKNATEADKQPNEKNFLARDFQGGQMSRDMTLFVDDDGRAYHIASSEENRTLHISLLTDDFMHTSGQYVRILPGKSNEGAAVFKRGGRYFLISSACSGWEPNAARLASADSIWGPWQEHGNPCVGSPEQVKTTFHSQSTFILPAPGKPGSFIFLADRWNPKNAIDGRYVWLPIQFHEEKPFVEWKASWNLGFFDVDQPR